MVNSSFLSFAAKDTLVQWSHCLLSYGQSDQLSSAPYQTAPVHPSQNLFQSLIPSLPPSRLRLQGDCMMTGLWPDLWVWRHSYRAARSSSEWLRRTAFIVSSLNSTFQRVQLICIGSPQVIILLLCLSVPLLGAWQSIHLLLILLRSFACRSIYHSVQSRFFAAHQRRVHKYFD